MFRDLQILCEQYDFSTVTDDINEVNFFADLEPILLDTIDLTDYLLRKSPVVFNNKREEIDKFNDSIRLYSSFDTLKLELSNAVKPKLFDFFALDNNDTNGFLDYKILVYKDEELIFQGVLRPNDIVYNMPLERNEREVISVSCYGWEKEFKDYFSNKEMPDLTDYWFNQNFLGINKQVTSLILLINGLFNIAYGDVITDRGYNNDRDLNKWRIVRTPEFIAPNVSSVLHLIWFQNGYDYIKSNTKLSSFDFFRKLCNSMGWVFYFKIVENDIKFVVRNRTTSDDFYTTVIIDNSDVIGYTVEYSQFQQKVRTVKIPTIEVFGGDKLVYAPFDWELVPPLPANIQGKHDLIFNKTQNPPLADLIFFQNANIQTDSHPYIRTFFINDYGFSKYYSIDTTNTIYENIFYDINNVDQNISIIERFNFNYETIFLLEIDAGHNDFNDAVKRRINFQDAVASDYRSGDNISDRDMIYAGNIGTAMFRNDDDLSQISQYISNNGQGSEVTNYSKSIQFQKNIEALITDDSNLILNIKINGFFPLIDTVIAFTNPDDIFPFGYIYDIISAEADFINNETSYSLRRKIV